MGGVPFSGGSDQEYRQTQKMYSKFFLKFFNNKAVNRTAIKYYFSQKDFDVIKQFTFDEFEALIPQVPYLGGSKNQRMKDHLLFTTLYLAMYRILRINNWETYKIGQLIYDLTKVYYNSFTTIQKWWKRVEYFSSWGKFLIRRESDYRKVQGRFEDYQTDFVRGGKKKNFDWGLNYTECGAMKFLQNQDAKELGPYICLLDYAMYRAFGIGFKRKKSIGMGDNICEVQFSKRFDTPEGWPPDEVPEFQHYMDRIKLTPQWEKMPL